MTENNQKVYVMYYWDQHGTDPHSFGGPMVYATLEQAKTIPEKKTGRTDWRETIGPWLLRLGNYWIEQCPIIHAEIQESKSE